MPEGRVAVTGLGVVSPAGGGTGEFWQAIGQARPCVKAIDLFDATNFPCRAGGQLDGFSARKFVPKNYRKAVKVMARDIEIAVAAADLAFRDSGIVTRGIDAANTNIDSKRLGCNIGAGLICTDLNELAAAVNTAVSGGRFDMKLWGRVGINNLTPLWLLKYLPNMLSCHVTIIHGAEGPSNTITCGDTSGLLAIGEAGRLIAAGRADAIIAGGAESKLNPMGLLRQGLLGRLCLTRNDSPTEACRPFDAGHDGTVIGEGGGLVILEDMARAAGRKARIYAELAGFGAACDPGGMDVTRPTAGSLDLAVAKAIADAKISPDQIGLVVAHGTGVAGEDTCELEAWKSALAPTVDRVPSVALTGAIGSTFAGAGGIALAAAALAIHNQTIPPTVNFREPADKKSVLAFSDQPRRANIRYAVVGGFSTGGQSAACVLKRHEA